MKEKPQRTYRSHLHEIIFEADTKAGKRFDVLLFWAIVTLTTVGYGDITPQTVIGQTLASIIMITGYAIIAVPTGIVTAEFIKSVRTAQNTQSCPSCSREGHDDDAKFCKFCGSKL